MKNNPILILVLLLFFSFVSLKSYSQSSCLYNNGITLVASPTSNSAVNDAMTVYFIANGSVNFEAKYDSYAIFTSSWPATTPELWTMIPNTTRDIESYGLPLFTNDFKVRLFMAYNNSAATTPTTLTASRKCLKGFSNQSAIWLLDSLLPANDINLVADSAYNFTFHNPSDLKRFAVCFDYNGTGVPLAGFSLSSGSNSVCPNNNVTLTFTGKAPASASYVWNRGNAHWVSGDTTGPGPIVVYWDDNHTGSQNLSLTVKGTCFSSQPNVVAVKVSPPVSITSQPSSVSDCPGNSASFSISAAGTNPLSYQWAKNNIILNGQTNSQFSILNSQLSDVATYTCIVAAACSTVTSNNALLTLNSSPQITFITPPKVKCSRDSALFKVVVSGISPSYQWQLKGSNIAQATQSIYTLLVSAIDTGKYYCNVSNLCGKASAYTSLTLLNPPGITLDTLQNMSICQGTGVNFTFDATGSELSYQWSVNSSIIAGATNSDYRITDLQAGNAGVYSCSVRNMCQTDNITPFELNINTKASINIFPVKLNRNIGDALSVSLSTVSGTQPMSFQWILNNNIISGATANSYSKNSIVCSDAGAYSCIISNICGSITALAATLFVTDCGDTISGKVNYDNTANTPIINTYVYLENIENQKLDSSYTDSTGTYMMFNVPDGSYNLVCGIPPLKWAGSNPVDALLVNRFYVGLLSSFGGDKALRELAANVSDGTKINPIDALLILRRYVALIKKFSIPDWLFDQPTINVNNASVIQNINANCAGDVNGSYPN